LEFVSLGHGFLAESRHLGGESLLANAHCISDKHETMKVQIAFGPNYVARVLPMSGKESVRQSQAPRLKTP
jgi:hypothetical protein